MRLRCVPLALLLIVGSAAAQPAERQPVKLRVLLPAANAELTVEGAATRSSGEVRDFVSPAIEPGQNYTYTLVATWRPNNYTTLTRTRKVRVRAGDSVEADLRRADDAQPDKIVIRYVPTPPDIVDAMLTLAGVGADDVVYDLGCGDGRIVVAAAGRFKAKRGVGVDLDPKRVAEAKDAAKAAKVDDKVAIRQGDVLEIKDLSEATVVALYMSDALNLRLRPILQKTLKPGARVVSHRFTMGDWKPAESKTVTGRDGERYEIHLWKIGQ